MMNAEGYISRRQAAKLLKVDGTNGSQIPLRTAKRLKMIYYRQSDFDALSGGPGLTSLAVDKSVAAVPTREGGILGSLESAPKSSNAPPLESANKILYAAQAAEILGITVGNFHTTMGNRKKAGKFVPLKHGNGRPYYKMGELLKFKDEHFGDVKKKRTTNASKRIIEVLRVMPKNTYAEFDILPDDNIPSIQTAVNHISKNIFGIKCTTERKGNKLIITRTA